MTSSSFCSGGWGGGGWGGVTGERGSVTRRIEHRIKYTLYIHRVPQSPARVGIGTPHPLSRKRECPSPRNQRVELCIREIQNGSGAKSSMRKGFLIYEEMREYFVMYEEAVSHIYVTCSRSLSNILLFLTVHLSVGATSQEQHSRCASNW